MRILIKNLFKNLCYGNVGYNCGKNLGFARIVNNLGKNLGHWKVGYGHRKNLRTIILVTIMVTVLGRTFGLRILITIVVRI